jgi:hypothetical protein
MTIAALFRRVYKRQLTESGPPSTFVRLLTSNHLAELQRIALPCLMILYLLLIVLFVNLFGPIPWAGLAMTADERKIAAGVVAATAAALNWTYQTGSKRLGVIDLFACEISAIARMTLIADSAVAQVRVAMLEHGGQDTEADSSVKFTSEEHYTPVYDGNLSDSQALDIAVISYVRVLQLPQGNDGLSSTDGN